jgi:hypothetical protein
MLSGSVNNGLSVQIILLLSAPPPNGQALSLPVLFIASKATTRKKEPTAKHVAALSDTSRTFISKKQFQQIDF